MAEHSATHDSGTAHSHSGHDFAHPFPVWGLLTVFVVLVFLTILTVAQAHLDMGSWDVIISLLIASVKASLVVLFFMHLAFDKPYNAIVFVGSLLFVALFLGATLTDSQSYRDTLEPTSGSETEGVE